MSKESQSVTVNITNKTMLRAIVWIVGVILAFRFVENATHALTLIFLSFFLALALNPVVSSIAKHLKSRSRVRATAAAYLVVLAVLSGFIVLIIPPLIQQTRDFINDAPTIVANFQNQDSGIADLARRYNIDDQLSKAAKDFASNFGSASGPIIDTGKRIGGTFISAIMIIVMTFMMLVEGPGWLSRMWSVVKPAKRAHHQEISRRMYRMVTGFVNGQVILAAIAGSFSLVALLVASNLLDISINAVALAGIVTILGLVPMIGNPISTTIVVIVCLLSSLNLAIIMLVYFVVYQQIENATLQPYIQSRQSELSPLIVFIAAILGISLGGIVGALAAIPLAGCVKILLLDYLAHRNGHHQPTEAIPAARS